MKTHTLAFVDLETTGLDIFKGEIIEIGIVLARQSVNAEGKRELTHLSDHEIALRPEHIETADPKALEICGYHERDWSHAVAQHEGLAEAARLLTGTIFIAQNVTFDWGFLLKETYERGIFIDNLVHYHKLDLASMVFGSHYHDPKLFRYSLRELAERFDITNTNAHTALSDARTAFEICAKVLGEE